MATHILVVDDETAIADLVEVYLKNEGFTIRLAPNMFKQFLAGHHIPLVLT